MGAAPGRRFVNTRSQIYFLDPDGMQVGWQTSAGPNGERAYLPAQLTVPARYNFSQGYIYRLKLTNIPGRAGAAPLSDDRGRARRRRRPTPTSPTTRSRSSSPTRTSSKCSTAATS